MGYLSLDTEVIAVLPRMDSDECASQEPRASVSDIHTLYSNVDSVRVVHVVRQSPRGLNTVCTSVVRKLDPMRARIRYQANIPREGPGLRARTRKTR